MKKISLNWELFLTDNYNPLLRRAARTETFSFFGKGAGETFFSFNVTFI
jgi:hypothetical protein